MENQDNGSNDHTNNTGLFHSELVHFLTESREMRHTARNSVKQSLWAGIGAFTGGMILGPAGGLVGGIVGSVAGFYQSESYDGVVLAIIKLPNQQREVLLNDLKKVLLVAGATVQQLDISTFRETLSRYAVQDSVRNKIWNVVMNSIDG